MKIILASESPRRIELLKMSGINFQSQSSDIDEDFLVEKILNKKESKNFYSVAEEITMCLAYEKANYIYEKYKNNKNLLVIGSDTLVVKDDKILGKPKNFEEAKSMLIGLCGKTHRVYTSVCMISNKKIDTFSDYTEVTFHEFNEITEQIIDMYIKTKSPFDKAGSYGIQDMGSLLVKKIDGDYYTVMGFPISKVYRKIKSET